MRKSRTDGSVRGALRKGRPYRDRALTIWASSWRPAASPAVAGQRSRSARLRDRPHLHVNVISNSLTGSIFVFPQPPAAILQYLDRTPGLTAPNPHGAPFAGRRPRQHSRELHFRGHIVRQVDQSPADRKPEQDRSRALRKGVLDDIDRIMDRLDGAAEVDTANDAIPP